MRKNTTIAEECSINLNQVLKNLEEIVCIDSRTENVTGVSDVNEWIQAFTKKYFSDHLFIKNKNYSSANLLHLKGPKTPANKKTVTMVVHSDTVLGPKPSFCFKEEESRVWGPGVADMKVGIIICLYGVLKFLEELDRSLNLSLNIIVSPNEESGSIGFHDYFREVGKSSDYVFCFEPGLSEGELIASRSGNKWFKILGKDNEFHTGREVKERFNLCHSISSTVSELQKEISKIDGLKFHVSSIQTNSEHFNRSSSTLECLIDVRFNESKKIEHFDKLLTTKLKKFFGDKYKLSVHDFCPTMENSKQFINGSWREIVEESKIKIGSTEGCSDINYFSNAFNMCLDGLGGVGSGMHSRKEFIYKDKIIERINLFYSMLRTLNAHSF